MDNLEQQEQFEEPSANPYNARKEWHTPDEPHQASADSLFFEEEEPTATRKTSAPKKQKEESSSSGSNYKKRYDDLKRHYDEKIAEFKQKEQELLAQAQSAQPAYEPPKSAEELEKFKTEYPDLYETVESVAHLRSQSEVQALQQKMQAIEEREAMISRREAETKLRERHPDFEDIRGDDEFHEWAKLQPEEIQRWIYNNPDNVGLASRAIDFYKMEKGLKINDGSTKSKSNAQPSKQDAADFVSTKTTAVDTKQPKVWTRREIAALSMDEYDRYEQEIDQAILEGRVVN
jgi:hypothetical protein